MNTLLIALVLAAQSPGAPDTGEPDEREEEAATLGATELATQRAAQAEQTAKLEKLARQKEPLPPIEELVPLLGLPDGRLGTLKERANELRGGLRAAAEADEARAAAQASQAAKAAGDGGSADAGPVADAGPLTDAGAPLPGAVSSRLKAELKVLERVLAAEFTRSQGAISRLVEEEQNKQRAAEEDAARASQAREAALESARSAASALLERTYARIAEVEGTRELIANELATLHERTAAELSNLRADSESAMKILGAAREAKPQSAEADRLLLEALAAERNALDNLETARKRLSARPPTLEQIATLSSAGAADEAALQQALKTGDRERVQDAIDADRSALAALQEEGKRLATETDAQWYRVAAQRLELAATFDAARLTLIPKAGDDQASALRSVTDVGADNLVIAVGFVWQRVRFHNTRRAHDFIELRNIADDSIRLSKILTAFALVLALLIAAAWAWRRVPEPYEKLKKAAVASARGARAVRIRSSVLAIVEVVAPRGFLILVALWIHDILQDKNVAPEPETAFAIDVFLWIVGYQLSARLVHMLILRLARRRYSLTVPQKLRILRSVRLAMRYGFVVAYTLDLTAQFVGHGVLYDFARFAAFIGSLPLVAVLVQRWREDIVRSYLEFQPDTRLARLVERTGERWYGFFVALAAFGVVAGRGLALLSRDFVLGFEQTRRALAYLFRLRIERQAQKHKHEAVDVEALPDEVREAFEDAPTDQEKFLVPRFAAMEEVLARVARFPIDAGAVALHAPYGIGRTTWLGQLEREFESRIPSWRFTPTERMLSPQAVATSLGAALEIEVDSVEQLAKELCALERRAVIIDGLEWFFLRDLNGYAGIEAMIELMQRTRGEVMWILSAPTPAWEHLRKTRGFDLHMGKVLQLGRWSEPEIRELVHRRQRVSGHEVSFEDLLVGEMESEALPAQVVETEDGYIRLLWNFAEGSPRVAQLFWLRSLFKSPNGELRVRLYDAPAADDLEVLDERDRFVLATVYLHRVLTPEMAARACRLPQAVVSSSFARAHDLGLFESAGSFGLSRISLAWWEAAVRYLRRKNIITN